MTSLAEMHDQWLPLIGKNVLVTFAERGSDMKWRRSIREGKLTQVSSTGLGYVVFPDGMAIMCVCEQLIEKET